MRRFRFACVGLVASVQLLAGAARGADKSPDAVRAEALFDEGRRLMAASDYMSACPKFADSEALDPAPGTALNLATCYQKAGKLASAWAAFRTAETLALAAGEKARSAHAQKKALALVPELSRLTVSVPSWTQVEGLEVRCDHNPVQRSEWGVAMPRDGGGYDVEATAPGKKAWTAHVELSESGQSLVVDVPPLEDAPLPQAPATAAAPPVEVPLTPTGIDAIEQAIAVASKPPPSVVRTDSSQRAVGLVTGAAGVLGLGVAGVIGFNARSRYETALPEHGQARVSDSRVAYDTGNVGTIVAGLGAMVTLAGAAIWLTAPKTTVFLGTNGGALLLRGRF